MIKKVLVLAIMMISLFPGNAIPFDNEISHPDLTENAVYKSKLENYLFQYLGFKDKLKTKLPSDSERNVLYWLRKGGADEDTPLCRAVNHFHDPLQPWDKSFMSDDTTALGWIVRDYCSSNGWPYSERRSNITWATGYLSPEGTRITPANQWMGWKDARDYYYWAITSASQQEQESNFVKTFQALGQVSHLLHDMGVPAHVRNDFTSHLSFLGNVSENLVDWFGNYFEDYVRNNPGIISGAEPAPVGLTNSRVTDFWDTGRYALAKVPITDSSIGLAEITSANYFSDTTIINNQPGEGHIYNYPKVDGGNSQICEDYEVGTKKVRKYISRRSKGDCPPLSEKREADHFAAVSLLQSVVSVTDENIPRLNLWLDNNVHNTYARELIPKVIGYSAALLDYFFRGKLQVTVLPIFYQNNLSYVRLKVRNMTPNEAMERGEFALRYRYTPPGGPEDGSGDIYGQAWNLDGSLSVPCPELKSGEEQTYDFQVFDNVPVDILNSLKFILAFRGTLGNEEGAVIGRVFGPGEVKFNEEWNNGFHGNYAWFHAGIDEPVWEPGSGTVLNVVVDGRLVKENVIFPGVGGQRLNKSDVGGEGPYQDIFPILVTPRTYLQFKVDDISIARNPASPPDWKADHYQCVRFDFSKGYSLLFSQGEYDPVWDRTKTAHYIFPLGYIIVDSIHGLFERSGIQIPEGPFYLWSIGFHQLLFDAYEESEYREHMAVDFVRVVEEKENP